MPHHQDAGDAPVLLTLPPLDAAAPEHRGDRTAPLDDHWLVELVRTRDGAGFLPPHAGPGPDGTLALGRPLAGPDEAARLARLLATPDFAPLRTAADRIAAWCAATAGAPHAAALAPGVLVPENTDLFGPVLLEVFQACAGSAPDTAGPFAETRAAQYEAALTLFLTRLHRDLAGPDWPADAAWCGPVTALSAGGAETHSGGQRVLRVTLAGGARVAYKPRPADGEVLLMDDDSSLFALLNSLTGAAGPVRLPTLHAWRGPADDAGYSWQEWLEPPAEQGTLRSEGPWRLTGTVLPPHRAAHFWRRTGNLTAAVFALGLTDLTGDNVLTGARPGDEPLTYPVDLESCLCPVPRLSATSLLPVPGDDPDQRNRQHHVGIECEARWCDLGGPVFTWHEAADGTLELRRRLRSTLRTHTRAVVADTGGRTGYAPYVTAMLRGMFDAWTLLVRHRDRVSAYLTEHAPHTRVRYIARSTSVYTHALGAELWPLAGSTADAPPEFDADELRQLAQGDVPYFHRTADGGPLRTPEPPPGPFREAPAEVDSPHAAVLPPHPDLLNGARLTLAELGGALYDTVRAVEHQITADEVHDQDLGVWLARHADGGGEVAFDWPEMNRRITYQWTRDRLRLDVSELVRTPEATAQHTAEEARTP